MYSCALLTVRRPGPCAVPATVLQSVQEDGVVTTTDDGLVGLISRGDPAGMEQLYTRYGGLVYSLAMRVLNDSGAAEEVVQEALLSVWRRSSSYDVARGSFRAWLCTIVRHRAVDRLRARQSRPVADLPLDAAVTHHAAENTWAEVEAGLEREQIVRALGSLAPEQRETIELAYFGGYSQTEISGLTGTPLGTVKGRVRLGLQRLRALLEGVEAEWTSS